MKHHYFRSFFHLLLATFFAIAAASTSAQEPKPPIKFTLQGTDANGKAIALSDYLGKTVLVSFYTAGCNLCTRDLKLMREFYGDNAKNNFVLLAVNIDTDKSAFDSYNRLVALSIAKERRFPSVWRGAEGHRDNFGNIVKQPTHFVINAKGEFVLKREGTFQPADWDNLWELLGN